MGVDRMSQYEADKLGTPSKAVKIVAAIPFVRKLVEKPSKPSK